MYSARGGGVTSRRAPQTSRSVEPVGIVCNRCHKALTTTLFVCACDCVFCEECTYAHFAKNRECPSCDKTLSADDFLELVVADPTSQQNDLKSTFQGMFTKYSSNSSVVAHNDMCSRVLKSFDAHRRAVKFLLKQMVAETNSKGQHSGHLGRENAQLKQELTQLKQAANSERINHHKTTADLQSRLKALQGTVDGLQASIKSKENQIAQYREIFASEGRSHVPASSHSSGGGKRGQPSPGLPPMQGFVQRKHAQERENHHQFQQMTRGRSPFDNANNHHPSGSHHSVVIPPSSSMGGVRLTTTPIAIPGSSRSVGSNGSITPRIRDFTSSSGYHIHSRGGGAPTFPTSKRSRSSHSPTTAFAHNNPSSSHYMHPRRSSSFQGGNSSRGYGR